MIQRNELSEEEKYDTWAIRQIMKGRECHFDRYLRCIPNRAKECKTCYTKDISRKEKAGQFVEMVSDSGQATEQGSG